MPKRSSSLRATLSMALEQTTMFDLGAVHGLHLAEARVARQRAQDAQAQFVEQRRTCQNSPAMLYSPIRLTSCTRTPARWACGRHRIRLARADDIA